ncbi:MAG: stage II sporulation protein M [Planctomycetota bacterium]
MNVAELTKKRQPLWTELENLCEELSKRSSKLSPENVNRFSVLYRAACADLALAESYHLPPSTVDYLHRLVAKAHNQLYRSQSFRWNQWYRRIFVDIPKIVFNDPCIHLVIILFWGLFLISAFLAFDSYVWPSFAAQVVGQEQLDIMESMYTGFDSGRGSGTDWRMAGFYVNHNASIGLSCFVTMLFVLPGLVTLSYNAVSLGTVFGYMFRAELGDASSNFQNFVTAHGPFELTAIVLAAGAGLKIGLSWVKTNGLTRSDSLLRTARESLPIIMCSVVLFCLAAILEGFLSPASSKYLPWFFKGLAASFSSFLLMFYFIVLGFPDQNYDLESERDRWTRAV